MGWYLYVIECADGSLYTGIAVDPEARFAAHAAGKGARYTRSHPPLRLVLTEPHADRSSALRAEYAFKRLPAAEKRRRVL
ncbi:MAG TPA: GIY-YIG nuclease family protein [Myxococcota bacterium]|nr:GIY-YIG nuclease family protein [Myxococcota bacterium]